MTQGKVFMNEDSNESFKWYYTLLEFRWKYFSRMIALKKIVVEF